MSPSNDEARAAWARIEGLGGRGVWDADMVVVSFADTDLTDADLEILGHFPFVQILDLSGTAVTDRGLDHLREIPALEELIVTNTRMSEGAIEAFRASHPAVKVTTQPRPGRGANPFIGEPF